LSDCEYSANVGLEGAVRDSNFATVDGPRILACRSAPILYGTAYYEEYPPYDRSDADVELMKSAGISVARITESTWGTLEPQDGVFDYSHIPYMR
jgi:beta-galactosidase GanA